MRRAGWIGVAALLVLSIAAGFGFADQPARGPSCRRATFEGDGFTVCLYDPKTEELRLAWRAPERPLGDLKALQAWLGADAARAAFAMNAGMYDADLAPLGLFVADGRRLRPLNRASGSGNFFLKPNGVFWLDEAGAAHIEETAAFAAHDRRPRWATQSGPLLLEASALHPAIMPNGISLNVRNGVGVRDGEALFAISEGPVSFGRFARFFRDGLGCSDALYLDGAVSSLWAPDLGRRDGRTGLGTFVVVLRRVVG